jgi:putative transposase
VQAGSRAAKRDVVATAAERRNAMIRSETYAYIGGIIANKKGQLLEIGGINDHIHVLASCPATIALAEFACDIKANSSKWLHEEKQHRNFQWQTGYGAFTVSYSQIDAIRQYICNQAEHHKTRSFEDEFRTILQRHQIAFEEQFLFESEFHG